MNLNVAGKRFRIRDRPRIIYNRHPNIIIIIVVSIIFIIICVPLEPYPLDLSLDYKSRPLCRVVLYLFIFIFSFNDFFRFSALLCMRMFLLVPSVNNFSTSNPVSNSSILYF